LRLLPRELEGQLSASCGNSGEHPSTGIPETEHPLAAQHLAAADPAGRRKVAACVAGQIAAEWGGVARAAGQLSSRPLGGPLGEVRRRDC